MDTSEISRIYMMVAPAVGMAAAIVVAHIAGDRARRSSVANDRRHRAPGTAEQLVLGPALSSVGAMRRYSALRRTRGESRATTLTFWGAIIAVILCGLIPLAVWLVD